MITCKKCESKTIMSWSEQKSQYGKLRKLNYSHAEAKKLLPMCPVCFKKFLATGKDASVASVAGLPL